MTRAVLLIAAAAAAVAGVAYSSNASAAVDPNADTGTDPSVDPTTAADSSGTDTSAMAGLFSFFDSTTVDMTNSNLRAFLDMIAVSEGTYGRGDNGYNILVGGGTFGSYMAHPRQRVWIASIGNYSTAAGRYQIIWPTWQGLQSKLGLTDFSPASQDAAAVELIREHGALSDVYAGNIASAISKCRTVWASLPGAGYGQHENALGSLIAAYQNAGGSLA